MFDIGGPELLVIVLGIIVLFGPKKIPEIAQMIGKGVQKVRTAQSQFKEQLNEIKTELDKTGENENFAKNEPLINEIKAADLNAEHFSTNKNSALKRDQISTHLGFDKDKDSENSINNTSKSEELGFKPIEPNSNDLPYELDKPEREDE